LSTDDLDSSPNMLSDSTALSNNTPQTRKGIIHCSLQENSTNIFGDYCTKCAQVCVTLRANGTDMFLQRPHEMKSQKSVSGEYGNRDHSIVNRARPMLFGHGNASLECSQHDTITCRSITGIQMLSVIYLNLYDISTIKFYFRN
jgi:hypothetical protein